MKLVDLLPLKEGAFGMNARELADTYSLERLQSIRDEVMGDMEQVAEPEGGNIADMYADQLHGLDQAITIKKGDSGGMTYDQAIGRVSKDQFIKSKKFDRGGNRIDESEDKWNALDVSRKAEKEIDNKEWNSRTTAKLNMLIALNKAGKFKKDFSDERLQGWVDQNYSWEKLSRQFKLNESYNTSNVMNVSSVSENTDEMDEGSCGYGPNGVPGDTPGETRGMPADTRTMTMMREVIKKEIKKLSEKKGVPHYTKDGKEWKGATHKMPNGPLMTQDPHSEDSVELFHKEDLEETSLDDKLRGALGDKDFEKATSRKVPGFADIKPKEKKSKFKKAGEKSGFDMRGLK